MPTAQATCTVVVMAFGALLALIGVLLSTRGKAQAKNVLKMFGFEFQLAGSPLVIFVVGCALFVIPIFAGEKLAAVFPGKTAEPYVPEPQPGGTYEPAPRPGGVELTGDDSTGQEPGVSEAWDIIRAHMSEDTGALLDMYNFRATVLNMGSLRYPNALDLGGKQGIDRFVITVMNEYHQAPLGEDDYVYRQYVFSIHSGGDLFPGTGLARRLAGSYDTWEQVAAEAGAPEDALLDVLTQQLGLTLSP